jgi:hypothetical protein
MQEINSGLVFEGFVQRVYARIFDKNIEVRHFPITAWCQATVSGEQRNFTKTRDEIVVLIQTVLQAFYNEKKAENIIVNWSYLEASVKNTKSVDELGKVIFEALPMIDATL